MLNIIQSWRSRSKNCKYSRPRVIFQNIRQPYMFAFQFKYFVLSSFVWYSMVSCNQFLFQMFCSKHLIPFENTYLLSCLFYCFEMLCMKFRFSKTFTVTNFVTRILLIETLPNFRLLSVAMRCFTLYLHMDHLCFRLV